MFNQEDLQNILTLINFHDDWDEVKELYDIDLNSLFGKVHAALDNTNDWWTIKRPDGYYIHTHWQKVS